MNDPETRYQHMLDTLRSHQCRVTSHRLALLKLLSVSEDHPNATHLYERLRQQFPTISLATVYKTLALLKEEGEVLEIDLHADSHYDGNKPYPHPHLVCRKCHRIIDGEDIQQLEQLEKEINQAYSFQVTQAQLVFYGYCLDCQNPV